MSPQFSVAPLGRLRHRLPPCRPAIDRDIFRYERFQQFDRRNEVGLTYASNVRIYFWRKGQRKVRIREAPGTEAFEKRYRELLSESDQGLLRPVVGPSRAEPGTWRWLCIQCFGSSTFRMLDPKTHATRRGILGRTFEEPIFPSAPQTFADIPIKRFTGKHVRMLRDRNLKLPNAANGRVKCVGYVFFLGR